MINHGRNKNNIIIYILTRFSLGATEIFVKYLNTTVIKLLSIVENLKEFRTIILVCYIENTNQISYTRNLQNMKCHIFVYFYNNRAPLLTK